MKTTSPAQEIDRLQAGGDVAPLPPRIRRLLEGSGWTLLRLVADGGLLLGALVAARLGAPTPPGSAAEALSWLFPPAVLAILALRGMYGRGIGLSVLENLRHVLEATSLAAIFLLALSALLGPSEEAAPFLVRAWAFGTAYVGGGRLLLGLTQREARRQRVVGKPTLIIGAGQIGAQVERRLEEQPELGLRAVGYLDADPAPADAVPGRRAPVLGPPSALAGIAEEHGVEHVILAFLSAPDHVLTPLVRECEARGLEVSLVPRLFESVNVRVGLEHIGGLPLFGLRSIDPKGWHFLVKHAIDRLVAAILILLLSPVLVAAALAVKLSSPGPVFFRQRRIGRDGHDFEMLKFRTMYGSPEDAGQANVSWAQRVLSPGAEVAAAPAVERRTPVGRFLRRHSIDELPQLFNVLLGDMSLVGPRPELPHYVRMFEEHVYRYGDRHRVKSGITGWAQVHGLRGNTSLADRVEWDNHYIANWSLAFDLKILLMTVAAIFQPAE